MLSVATKVCSQTSLSQPKYKYNKVFQCPSNQHVHLLLMYAPNMPNYVSINLHSSICVQQWRNCMHGHYIFTVVTAILGFNTDRTTEQNSQEI